MFFRSIRSFCFQFVLLHAPRLQLTVEETVDIAGTLVVETSGVALQPLVGVRVDDRGESLLHGELRLVFDEQQVDAAILIFPCTPTRSLASVSRIQQIFNIHIKDVGNLSERGKVRL